MITRPLFVALAFLLCASGATADDYQKNLDSLGAEVRDNPLTKNGYWLETQNAFDEWEKLLLVFGYADPGDEAACDSLKNLIMAENAAWVMRCNPVD